jgi:cobalt/nickel transport system permease protein/energy-coupling factor transport system permease protein
MTRAARTNNPILDLNPLSQLAVLVVLAIASLLYGPTYNAVQLVVLMLVAAAAGCLAPFLKMWLKTVFFVSVVVFILQALLLPGDDVIAQVWILEATREGVDNALSLVTRIVGVGTAIILGIQVVDVRRMTRALEQRGVSPTVTYVILSTLSMIPQMGKKMDVIMDAQRSRGVETDSNLWVRAQAFFPTLGPLIINSVVGVEERAITLEARGFSASGRKTSLTHIPDTKGDRLVRAVALLFLAFAIVVRMILWVR